MSVDASLTEAEARQLAFEDSKAKTGVARSYVDDPAIPAPGVTEEKGVGPAE